MSLCPSCGSPISPSVYNCEFCGNDLPRDGAPLESMTDFLKNLDKKIAKISKRKVHITEEDTRYEEIGQIVKGLRMPEDKKDLMQFGLYVISNYEASAAVYKESHKNIAEVSAWFASARQVKNKLFLSAGHDSQALKMVQMVDDLKDPDTLQKEGWKLLSMMFAGAVVFFVIMAFVITKF